MRKKSAKYKKCPRCGNHCLPNQAKCEECGLIFARMEFASNKAAKKKLLKFDNDFVIYTNQYPADVSYWKIFFLTIFTGLVGGQYYYVGKYVKGGLMSASFVYALFCMCFSSQMSEIFERYFMYLPIGIAVFAWLFCLVFVFTHKFKVPVTIMMPDNVEYRRAEFESVKTELEEENKKAKKTKLKIDKKEKEE